jgi:flagellar assembly protein FliH
MTWSANPVRFCVAPRTFVLAGEVPSVPDAAALDEAHARGWEEGATHAQAQLLEQRSDFAALQESVFEALAAQHRSLVEQFTAALSPLAGQIAAKVLAGLQPDAELVSRIVAETLAEVEPGTPEVEVALCPLDAALVETIAAEYGHRYPGLRFRPDASLKPGDCRVQSRFGAIDARVRTKLENALRSMS